MNAINVTMLNFLKLSIGKTPVTFEVLRHFLRGYKNRQLRNSLQKLEQRRYITKSGKRTHYIYSITLQGLDYILQREKNRLLYQKKKALEWNLQNELSKYIRMLDGGSDI